MMKAESETIEPDLSGQNLDRYKLLRRLGMGGMGSVYEAEHAQLRKRVALKLLHHELSRKEIARKRFLREARAASAVRHPHIVDISDFGDTPDGHVFFVMELLDGCDLQDVLEEEGRLDWPRTQEILRQVTAAIGSAHKQGVIHRDIKPSNCFLAEIPGEEGKDFVKVVDFGIAKLGGKLGKGAEQLTSTDELFGTVGYMAPELVTGVTDDPRSDIYALGVMMYRMLVGKIPFAEGTAFQILSQHINEPPPRPRDAVPSIPEGAERIIFKALAKKPEDRFQSMEDFGAALARGDTEEAGVPSVEKTEVLSSKIVLDAVAADAADAAASVTTSSSSTSPSPTDSTSPPSEGVSDEPLDTTATSTAATATEEDAASRPITGSTVVSSRHSLVDLEVQTSPPQQDPAAALVSSPDGAIETVPPAALEPQPRRSVLPWLVPSILVLAIGGGAAALFANRSEDEPIAARQKMAEAPTERSVTPSSSSPQPVSKAAPSVPEPDEPKTPPPPTEPELEAGGTDTTETLVPDDAALPPAKMDEPPAEPAPSPVEATPKPTEDEPKARPKKAKPRPKPKPRSDKSVIKRLRSKILARCKDKGDTKVEIEGVISPTGQVASPLVTPPTGPGACARKLVKAAKFDPEKGVRAMPPFSVDL